MQFANRRPCLTFVLLVVLTPYAVLVPLLASGAEQQTLQPLKLLFAFTPLLYAFLVVSSVEGEAGVTRLLKKCWSGTTHAAWYLVAIFVFLVFAILSLSIRWWFDGFFPPRTEFASWPIILLSSLPLLLFPGITEEFAWRGFLQSRMQTHVHWVGRVARRWLRLGSMACV